jgi:uncharacterized protein YjdB
VKAIRAGTATITATSAADAGKTASCTVTVGKATPALDGSLEATATYGDTMATVQNWLDSQKPLGVDNSPLNGSWAWTTVQASDPVGDA